MILTCLPKFMRKSRYKDLIVRGNDKIDNLLDIRNIIETIRVVHILKKIILNRKQIVLSGFAKVRFICSSSSSSESEELQPFELIEKQTKELLDYPIRTQIDRRLIQLI